MVVLSAPQGGGQPQSERVDIGLSMELYDRCPGCGRLFAAVGLEHECELASKAAVQAATEAHAANERAFAGLIRPETFVQELRELGELPVADPIQDDRAA